MTLDRHEYSRFSSFAKRTTNANNANNSPCEARPQKKRDFHVQLLHYFSNSNNKSNHHHVYTSRYKPIYTHMYIATYREAQECILQRITRNDICMYVWIHKCNTCACIHTTQTHDFFHCVSLCVYVSEWICVRVCVCVYLYWKNWIGVAISVNTFICIAWLQACIKLKVWKFSIEKMPPLFFDAMPKDVEGASDYVVHPTMQTPRPTYTSSTSMLGWFVNGVVSWGVISFWVSALSHSHATFAKFGQ